MSSTKSFAETVVKSTEGFDCYGTVRGVCGNEVYVLPDGVDEFLGSGYVTLTADEFKKADVNPIKNLRVSYRHDPLLRENVLVGVQTFCWKHVRDAHPLPILEVPTPVVVVVADGSHI